MIVAIAIALGALAFGVVFTLAFLRGVAWMIGWFGLDDGIGGDGR